MMRPSEISGSPLYGGGPARIQVNIEAWMNEASCAQVDPELWYSDQVFDQVEAIQICARCTVRAQCLNRAREHETRTHLTFGIWGGLTAAERRSR